MAHLLPIALLLLAVGGVARLMGFGGLSAATGWLVRIVLIIFLVFAVIVGADLWFAGSWQHHGG